VAVSLEELVVLSLGELVVLALEELVVLALEEEEEEDMMEHLANLPHSLF